MPGKIPSVITKQKTSNIGGGGGGPSSSTGRHKSSNEPVVSLFTRPLENSITSLGCTVTKPKAQSIPGKGSNMQSQKSSSIRNFSNSRKRAVSPKPSKTFPKQATRSRSRSDVTAKKQEKKNSGQPVNKAPTSNTNVENVETQTGNKNNTILKKPKGLEETDEGSYFSRTRDIVAEKCLTPTLRAIGGYPPLPRQAGKSSDLNDNNDSIFGKHRLSIRSGSRVSFVDTDPWERDALRKMRSMTMVRAVEAYTNIDPSNATSKVTCDQQSGKSQVMMENGNLAPEPVVPVPRSGSLPSLNHHRHHQNSHSTVNRHHIDAPPSRPVTPIVYDEPPLEEALGVLSTTAVATFIIKLIKNDPNEPSEVTLDNGISSYIVGAYNVLVTLLDYVLQFIGPEHDKEPQEDFVRYNGYKIKVFGNELLLEAIHMNRDYQVVGDRCQQVHMCDGTRECRIRIVVRISGPSGRELTETGRIDGHYIRRDRENGKWSFFLNQNHFVEIGCPTGVHPETLASRLEIDGLLYIDAP